MKETPNLRTEENERRKYPPGKKEKKKKGNSDAERIVLIGVLLLFASAARESGPKDEIKKTVVVDCEDRDAPSTAESRRCAVSGETTTPRANHTRITHRHTQQRHGTIYKGSARNVKLDMAASRQYGSQDVVEAEPEGLACHQRRFAYYRGRHHQLTESIELLSISAILS
jgi:hypothetical protein